MAATTLELNAVSTGAQAAKLVVEQLKPFLDRLNIVYDGAGNVKASLTQAKLDEVPSFSGLTKAELDDGMYALTAALKGAIDASYSQLVNLAARA